MGHTWCLVTVCRQGNRSRVFWGRKLKKYSSTFLAVCTPSSPLQHIDRQRISKRAFVVEEHWENWWTGLPSASKLPQSQPPEWCDVQSRYYWTNQFAPYLEPNSDIAQNDRCYRLDLCVETDSHGSRIDGSWLLQTRVRSPPVKATTAADTEIEGNYISVFGHRTTPNGWIHGPDQQHLASCLGIFEKNISIEKLVNVRPLDKVKGLTKWID